MPNLVKRLKDNTSKVVAEIKKGSTWGSQGSFTFDAVVGNPPYQVEVAKKQSETNGQARRSSIFQYFQMAADAVSSGFTSLIYPGSRWIHRSGKGMEEFGRKQINDPHLAEVHFWPDSGDVFPGMVAIADGISIVMKDMKKATSGFRYVYHRDGTTQVYDLPNPGEDLMPLNPCDGAILAKVRAFCAEHGLASLNEKVYSQKFFGIESDFVAKNQKLVRPYARGVSVDWDKEAKLLANDKAGMRCS